MVSNNKQASVQNTDHQLTIGGNNDPLLPKLEHAINHASIIEITVSFIQQSGLKLLFEPLQEALERGVSLQLLTSDYLDITDPKALRELMTLVDRGADIRIYQSDNTQSFHMKSYIFVQTSDENASENILSGCAFIGSNNISKSALTNAHEWCYRHDYQQPDSSHTAQQFHAIRQAFKAMMAHDNVCPLKHNWIDRYIERRKPQKFIGLVGEQTEDLESISPRAEQVDALIALDKTRKSGYQRGLVVLATGMGKTWLSAFDAQQMKAKRILFVAHREEILIQAQRTFTKLLTLTTGLYNGKSQEKEADCLFASVQTIGRTKHLKQFSPDHFDYIVVDEFHHASAPVYRQLLNYFTPKFLLGLTATPERTDQADILGLCDNNLVFERNLIQGIDQQTLVPFHYYGIWDEHIDYQAIPWRNGRFEPTALENKFATQKRAQHALSQWQKYKLKRTLGFCISTKHADYMAQFFNDAGINAISVHSQSKVRRNDALKQLANGEIDVLFAVDLFNEGTDLPSIDTILMLRPSESKILFMQQLGRGLRTHPNKTHLVVLDFIGNHHSFLNKPYALLNENTPTGVVKQLKNPTLANGCFIDIDLATVDFLEQLAKEQRTTALEDLTTLTEELGHLPTASEFYYRLGSLKKVTRVYNSWFELIAKTENIDEQAQQKAVALAPFYPFLQKGVETTSMSKCFKAILLLAYVQLNGFRKAPTVAKLAQASADLLTRHPALKQHDLAEKEQKLSSESTAWKSYWQKNPIRAYTSINKDGTQWFVHDKNDDVVKANFKINDEQIDDLNSAVNELAEYNLAKYSQRIKAQTVKTNQVEKSEETPTPLATVTELQPISTPKVDPVNLPYFPNLKIACGHFKTGDNSDVEYKDVSSMVGQIDVQRHFLARASGNSMNGGKSPILDGQLLLLEWITATNAGSLQHCTVAIEQDDISGDSQYLLRDIKKVGDGEYLLIAKNPEYEPISADENMRTFARLKQVIE